MSMELPEVCVNIWCIVDQGTRLVYRVAARAYALGVSDSSKEKLLKFLAHTDFHLAKELPVLKGCEMHIVDPSGEGKTMPGGIYPRDIKFMLEDIVNGV